MPGGWRGVALVVAAAAHAAAGFEVPLTHTRTGRPRAHAPQQHAEAQKDGRLRGSVVSKRLDRTVDLRELQGVYAATIEVGTPPRPFRVHLDTGSSSLYVAAPYSVCPSCDPHFDRAFDDSLSSTATGLSCADAQCGTTCDGACGFSIGSGDLDRVDEATSTVMQTNAFLGGDDTCSSYEPVHTTCRRCLELDTCTYKGDGICDDGSQGGDKYCDLGTDSADCDTTSSCCPASCCHQDGTSCAFHSIYGDGSGVAGKVVRDEVAFGVGTSKLGASAYFGQFDKVHGMDQGGLFEIAAIDGIFGVGGSMLNSGRVPVLDQIIAANKIPNVFGLCLGGFAGAPSALDVGTVDTQKFQGDLMYVPFVHGPNLKEGAKDGDFDYYNIAAPHRTDIGGADLKLPASDYAPSNDVPLVVIDSGTTMFQVATPVYTALVAAISAGASASAKQNGYVESEPGACFQAPAGWNPNDDYPTIRFWLTDTNGVEFALEWLPQHYLGISSQTESGIWCLGLADGGADDSPTIFGDAWMEAFYVGFDRINFMLGFAPVAESCGNHVQGQSSADNSWPIYGCVDDSFLEYDSAANAGDPSLCVTKSVEGCLSPHYDEYNPQANRDTTPTSCCTCTEGSDCPGLDASCPDPCKDASEACAADSDCASALDDDDDEACFASPVCMSLLAACTSAGSGGDPGACGTNTCEYHDDSECDDGSQGGTAFCDPGTDCGDCGNCCGAGECGTDTCEYHDDSECDDGSQGGAAYCDLGTDCGDCGNCCEDPSCSVDAMAASCAGAKKSSAGNCMQCIISKIALFEQCSTDAIDNFCLP